MSLLRQWRYLLLSIFAIVALTAFAACGDDDDDDGGDDGGEEPTETGEGGDVAPPEEQRLIMHSVEPEYVL